MQIRSEAKKLRDKLRHAIAFSQTSPARTPTTICQQSRGRGGVRNIACDTITLYIVNCNFAAIAASAFEAFTHTRAHPHAHIHARTHAYDRTFSAKAKRAKRIDIHIYIYISLRSRAHPPPSPPHPSPPRSRSRPRSRSWFESEPVSPLSSRVVHRRIGDGGGEVWGHGRGE